MWRSSEIISGLSRSHILSGLMLVLSLSVLSACAPGSTGLPGKKLDQAVGHALLESWQSQGRLIDSLQGMAKVKVKTPDGSGGGTQVVLAERPNRLRAETLSPFGTPMLTLASNGDQLNVILPTEGVYYSGQASAANVARFTRMPIQLADLVSVLLYRAPLIDYVELQSFALPDGGFELHLSGAEHRQELKFDSNRRLVSVRYLRQGTLLMRVDYTRFEDLVVSFPHEFAIELPEQQTVANLNFTELAVNRTFQPGIFQLSPPSGYKTYPLDDPFRRLLDANSPSN